MKKFIFLAGLVITVFTVSESKAVVHSGTKHFSISLVGDTAWAKAATWTGMYGNKKAFYKINPKNQVVYSSVNAKTWGAAMGGIWTTKDGKSIKIADKKLVWSADKGKTWVEVPDGTWQDADGDWCKFDSDWNLWIKKGS